MYLGVAAHEKLAVAGPGGLAGVARHQVPLEDLQGVLLGEQQGLIREFTACMWRTFLRLALNLPPLVLKIMI